MSESFELSQRALQSAHALGDPSLVAHCIMLQGSLFHKFKAHHRRQLLAALSQSRELADVFLGVFQDQLDRLLAMGDRADPEHLRIITDAINTLKG